MLTFLKLTVMVAYLSSISFASNSIQVSSSWLKTNLGTDNILIIDTQNESDYVKEHIPGSVNLPVNNTFRDDSPTYLIKNHIQLEKMIQKAGVNNDSIIVVYDNGEQLSAGRLFWIMEFLGHKNVSVLQGGLVQWKKANYLVQTGKNEVKKGNFSAVIDSSKIATIKMVKNAVKDPNFTIIDARLETHYQGKESITDIKGHIPTAINIPTEKVSGSKFLDDWQRKTRKLDKNADYITYCNKGKQSSYIYFLLRRDGFANVKHYDGSWPEWSEKESKNVEIKN